MTTDWMGLTRFLQKHKKRTNGMSVDRQREWAKQPLPTTDAGRLIEIGRLLRTILKHRPLIERLRTLERAVDQSLVASEVKQLVWPVRLVSRR